MSLRIFNHRNNGRHWIIYNLFSTVFLGFLFLVPTSDSKRAPEGVEDSPLTFISALMGSRVSLTCEVTPPVPGDRPILVLFYKGGIGTPIFSIDAREGGFDHGSQWVAKSVLGARAHFDARESSLIRPGLIVNPIQLKDAAQYRCRVDFKSSPTRNARIQLQVIDPPKKLKILNEIDEVVEGAIGPFAAGSKIVLRCEVEGGYPRPYVSWWRNSILVDDESETKTEDITSNILTLSNLTRNDLFASLTCHGSNSNLTAAFTSSVTIDMIFRPLELRFIGGEEPQREGTVVHLMCEVKGSRPAAEITWWKNGQVMNHAVLKKYNNGNVTRSSIDIAVDKEDNDAQVICRAQNPVIPSAVLEATRKLEVYYSPRPTLSPGLSVNIDEIKEGDDIFFECKIEANPPSFNIQWYFNENERLVQNLTSGVIESNYSLVLQKVTRDATGKYNCFSRNKYGKGISNTLQLRVKYSPVCVSKSPKVFGAEKNERMSVACNVEADPQPTQFEWAFNTSTEIVDTTWFKGHIGQEVSYTPRSDLDFGSLLCWASNEVGIQKIPCVIHVIHAGIPSPVRNCSSINVSSCCASIECQPGWNGGLEQSFAIEVLEKGYVDDVTNGNKLKSSEKVIEQSKITTRGENSYSIIYDNRAPIVLANTATSPNPVFVVEGLKGGRNYLVSIRAVNAKGHSEETMLTILTTEEEQQKRIAEGAFTEIKSTAPPARATSMMAAIMGIIISSCIVIIFFGLIIWRRHRLLIRPVKNGIEHDSPGSSSRELQISDTKSSIHEIDSGTPDIIQAVKEPENNQLLHVSVNASNKMKEWRDPLHVNEPNWLKPPDIPPIERTWKGLQQLPILRTTESSQMGHDIEGLPPPPSSFSHFPSYALDSSCNKTFLPSDIPPECIDYVVTTRIPHCPHHPKVSFRDPNAIEGLISCSEHTS